MTAISLRAALLLICFGLVAGGCGGSSISLEKETEAARTTIVFGAKHEPKVELPAKPPTHLIVKELQPGWGVEAKEGDLLTTKFAAKYVNGKPFESSWDPGSQPFSFHLGAEESSPAFEKGLRGMRVGGRRELIVPHDLASRFAELPPEDNFAYVVELTGVAPPQLDHRHTPKIDIPPGPPPKHLRVHDVVVGDGPEARTGDLVTMQYMSKHYTGKPFSNSWDDGHPFRVRLGVHSYKSIPGWEKGIPGMRVGGRREIIVPPDLIFQGGPPAGRGKPSETLVYVIDLYGITEGPHPHAPEGG
jgi:peptidylprolyl isomerase